MWLIFNLKSKELVKIFGNMSNALNKYGDWDSDVGCTKTYWECLANYYANTRNFNILSVSH